MKVETIVYAGRVKDRDILEKSSSGGAFTAISDYFLEKGDAVVAAVYDYEEHIPEFHLITTKIRRDSARGSKYMQSKMGDIFNESYKWLVEHVDKKLVFFGMGCQTEAFRLFSEKKHIRSRVIIVDIICHGAASPIIWNDYIRQIRDVQYVTFKNKRNGWNNPTALAIADGKEWSLDEYVRIFYNQCALRPSCYKCPFSKIERNTDITIGDFWHIEETIPSFYDPMGTSLFLIHSEIGQMVWEQIVGKLDYVSSNTTQCWQANLENPTPKSCMRDMFWSDYHEKGSAYVFSIYGSMKVKSRIIRKIKKMMSNVFAKR